MPMHAPGSLPGLRSGTKPQPSASDAAANPIGAVTVTDVFSLLAKSIVPGLLTGAICCDEGLAVGLAATEVPIAATRGVIRSVGALFVTSLLISIMAFG